MKFDSDQEKAVHSLKNTVVTAGAGSGKTSVLAARFIWLLKTQGIAIDEILTLTFTNKAAAEMYEKIYQSLLSENSEKVIAARIEFNKAQVSTIDSFCAQVVRNSSSLFGLALDFTSDEEALGKLAEETALDFALAHAEKKGVHVLLKKHGLPAFCSEFLARIAIEYLSLAADISFPSFLARQTKQLEELLPTHLVAFEDSARKLLGADCEHFKTVRENRSSLDCAADVRGLIDSGSYAETETMLGLLHLQKPGGKETESILLLKQLIDEIKYNSEKIRKIIVFLKERDTLEELFGLLDLFQDEFNAKKRNAKLVSFHDVAEMAVKALLVNKPLRQYYKKKFKFIMIDEFQDNNHLQKELLFLLAEKETLSLDRIPKGDELDGGKLFFVGDEKQSIYGFRGAEVDVFKALKKELKLYGGEVITLAGNYRSKPGLIGFFNRLFEKVMENPRHDFEAEFEALAPKILPGNVKPALFLFYKAYREEEEAGEFSSAESEAFALAAFIKETVEKEMLAIEQGGLQRPAGYGDFAVLMRSTANQIIFERMFRHLGVPYAAQNIRSLFLEPPVNDIYALLQCVLHPDDRLAYAALLRSPFAGISDAALLAILEQREPPFHPVSLTAEDEEKFNIAARRYQAILEKIDRVPISTLIFHAWYTMGYRYFIMKNPSCAMYLEYYDYLFALAARADEQGDTLEQFLSWIRKNLGRYEKLEEIELVTEPAGSVQIMTIHKAKGLEFPVVIAANMGNRGRNRERNSLIFFSKEYGLVINLNEESYFSALSAQEEEEREAAEVKRLLYVELSRAQSHLVLSGVHNRQNRRQERVHLSLLFQALGLSEENIGEFSIPGVNSKVIPIPDLAEEHFFREHTHKKKKDLAVVSRQYESIPTPVRDWRRSDFSVTELNGIYKNLRLDDDECHTRTLPGLPSDKYLKTDEDYARWGSLVHYVLNRKILNTYSPERLPFSLTSLWDADSLPHLVREAETLSDRFLQSEWGKLFFQAQERETEFPFLYRHMFQSFDYFIHGTIDLYFTTPERTFVIDFKTDRVLNILDYEAQLGIYRLALGELTHKPVAAFIYSLRSGEIHSLEGSCDLDKLFSAIGKME